MPGGADAAGGGACAGRRSRVCAAGARAGSRSSAAEQCPGENPLPSLSEASPLDTGVLSVTAQDAAAGRWVKGPNADGAISIGMPACNISWLCLLTPAAQLEIGRPWLQDSDGVRTRARSKASTAAGGGGDADGFAAAKGFADRRRDADASAAQLDTVPSAPHAWLT